MKLSIDRLADSPWHNGDNGTGAKYLDWEVLFRGPQRAVSAEADGLLAER
jgi:hypothetical protein